MESLLLYTEHNSRYLDALQSLSIALIPIPFDKPEELYELCGESRYALIQPEPIILERLYKETAKSSRELTHIFLTKDISEDLTSHCLCTGMVDILSNLEPSVVRHYMENVLNAHQEEDRFFILEDDPRKQSILRKITARYGYKSTFYATYDSLINDFTSPGFIMMNLTMDQSNKESFLRFIISSSEMRGVPIIPFVPSASDISIEIFTPGLRKLTRVIFSIKELYTFLYDMLSKKHILKSVAHVAGHVRLEENYEFATRSLMQSYQQHNLNLDSPLFYNPSSCTTLYSYVRGLENATLTSKGLQWLGLLHTEKVNTCVNHG